MPFVIEKTKDPLYKEGLYEGEKIGKLEGKIEGKIESAVIMVKDFEAKPEDVAKKLDIPLEILLKKLK
jgi:predicted transposase YdaD